MATSLAWAALRHRPWPWALLALGMALTALLPVASSGLRAQTTLASVRSAVEQVPAPQRAALAVTSQILSGAELGAVDRLVRPGFGSAGLASVQGALMFRPLALAGVDVTVGALDGLPAEVRLSSGRLPRSCHPTACEVLVIAPPAGGALPALPPVERAGRRLGLVVTGTARLTDPRLVGVRLAPAELPLLLGHDPAALAGLSSLSLFGRSTAWYGTVDGATVAARGVPAFSRALAAVADRVNAVSGPLSVSWPEPSVLAAAQRADTASARLGVLGAGAGALQLGFFVVAAAGLRRRQQLSGLLLQRRGASRAQVLLTTAVPAVLAVLLGLVVGLGTAALVLALRAGALVADPWSLAGRAVADQWPTVAVLAGTAVVLTLAVLRWPDSAGQGTQLVLDAALVAVLAGCVLLLAVGGAGSPGPLAASVVVLAAVAVGLLAARLWGLAARLFRLGGSGGPATQVALVAGRRRPLLARVTAGFVAAACCSLVFAAAYRSTLQQSAVDQAAAQVPLDVNVTPSAAVAVPLDVLDPQQLRSVAPGVALYPVVSSAVSAFAGTTSAAGLPLTGVDPGALRAVHQFGATTGTDLTGDTLAGLIAVHPAAVSPAPTLPAAGRTVTVQGAGASGDITLTLWVSTADGRQRAVALTPRGDRLTGQLESADAGRAAGTLTVQAIEISESPAHLVHRQHAIGEGSTDRALASGDLSLGAVRVDGRPVSWSWATWGSDQAQVRSATPAGARLHYQVADARVVLSPVFSRSATAEPLPVAVDPDTAARAGASRTFGITVNGVTIPARIVAVLPRMPTLGSTFVLADRAAVVALLNRLAPGTASVSQVWIAAPPASLDRVRQLLQVPPAAAATISFRADLSREVSRDPVARGSLAVLTLAGALALAMALVGVATAVRADLDESAADHLALELDGMPPDGLRRALLVRWSSVLAVGVLLGVAGGGVLAVLALRVLLGSGGGAVLVPVRPVLAVLPTAAVAAATLAGGLLLCRLVAAGAFVGAFPREPELDLR